MRIFFNECTIAAILWTDENLPSVYLAADLAPVRFGELLFAPSFDGVPVYVHGDKSPRNMAILLTYWPVLVFS